MTLYIMYGFAQGGASSASTCPKDMVQRGWQYLARTSATSTSATMHEGRLLLGVPDVPELRRLALSRRELDRRRASPRTSARQILDFSFKHWKQHSPYLRATWR